ncbi:MAG: precorrin-6A reductase [Candidatus Hydrothermarchaeales archaeon]
MIWVLSGTREGKELVELLKEKGYSVVASAVTEYGATLVRAAGADEVVGSMDLQQMMEFLGEKAITGVVDATHPFAATASQNAIKACRKSAVPYLRFERKAAKLPKSELIHIAEDFNEAGKIAADWGKVIFYAAGTNNLATFMNAVGERRVVARVLPSENALRICLDLGLTPNDIIAMEGPVSHELNVAFLKEYCADVLVMKESGSTGGTEDKVMAALELGIHAVVIKRPVIDYGEITQDYSGVLSWLLRESKAQTHV